MMEKEDTNYYLFDSVDIIDRLSPDDWSGHNSTAYDPCGSISYKYNDYSTNSDILKIWLLGVLSPLVSCLGVLGNAVVLVVLTRKEMISSTNCFLTALAASDLTLLMLWLPFDLIFVPALCDDGRFVVFYKVYKDVAYGALMTCQTFTCWLTTLLAVERYVTLRFLLTHPHLACSVRRARVMAAAVCLASALFNCTHFAESWSWLGTSRSYKLLRYNADKLLGIFFLPVVIMIIVNSGLLRLLLRHRRQMSLHHAVRISVDVVHVATAVFVVVLLYVLCYSLNVVIYVDDMAAELSPPFLLLPLDLKHRFLYVNTVLMKLNSALNIVVYTCCNRKFRKTLNSMVHRACSRCSACVCKLLPCRKARAAAPSTGSINIKT